MRDTNTYIEEIYCSLEVSKLLKEKGFNIPCNHYMYVDGLVKRQKNRHFRGRLYDRNIYADQYSIPTQSIALEWMRKNLKKWISSLPVWNGNDQKYYYSIYFFDLNTHIADAHIVQLSDLCTKPEDAINIAMLYVLEKFDVYGREIVK